MSTYLYGVVPDSHPADVAGLSGVGGSSAPVRVIDAGELRVIAGDIDGAVRARRRDLAAHTGVLGELCAQGATLPMRFGVLADDDSAAAREVRARQPELSALLSELDGRVEMHVKAAHRQDAVLHAVLAEDSKLRAMREDLLERGGEHGEQVRFGELVASAVARREHLDAEALVTALSPHAVRASRGDSVAGYFLNRSFLVDRADVPDFEAAVDSLRESVTEAADVRLYGPLPPFSFAGDAGQS